MKTKSLLLSVLLGLVLSITGNSYAFNLIDRIVEIAPSQAAVGQTIIVRLDSPKMLLSPAAQAALTQLNKQFRRGLVPGGVIGNRPAPKIYFTGANGQQTVEGTNVTSLGNLRYSVRVPNGARNGRLRFRSGIADSLSTVNFTLANTGYKFINFSQFNIVSIKVDNVERLNGQIVQATLPSNPDVFVFDVGTTPGNHSMQVTVGRSLAEPVMVYFLPSVQATSPLNEIEVGTMLAGEYMVASPNASISGNNITASWQTLINTFVPDGSPSGGSTSSTVNGFDFTFNASTNVTTWKNWNRTRTNVVGSGTVREPTSWLLNPTGTALQLANSNGSIYTTINVNFLTKTFTAPDGNSYELQ